jgi:hypothetical protein
MRIRDPRGSGGDGQADDDEEEEEEEEEEEDIADDEGSVEAMLCGYGFRGNAAVMGPLRMYMGGIRIGPFRIGHMLFVPTLEKGA